MESPPLDFDHLSSAISHATAPAFMLGAVAGFLSILVGRLERVIENNRALRSTQPPGVAEPALMTSLLRERMRLLNRAILLCVISALTTATLLVVSFAAGLLGFGHGVAVAVLFTVALVLLMVALSDFAREVRLHSSIMRLD